MKSLDGKLSLFLASGAFLASPSVHSISTASPSCGRLLASMENPTGDLRARLEAADDKVRLLMRAPRVKADVLKHATHDVWARTDLSDEQKIEMTFQSYVDSLLETASPELQEIARHALANIQTPKNEKAGYDSRTGLLDFGTLLNGYPLIRQLTLVHELEHVLQFGREKETDVYARSTQEIKDQNLKIPTAPTHLRHAEFEAIGAQWDFLQAIPVSVREVAISALRAGSRLPRLMQRTLVADISKAGLTREAYGKVIADEHGYSLFTQVMGRPHN